MIALGDTEAAGSVFQKIGELSTQDITTVSSNNEINIKNRWYRSRCNMG